MRGLYRRRNDGVLVSDGTWLPSKIGLEWKTKVASSPYEGIKIEKYRKVPRKIL